MPNGGEICIETDVWTPSSAEELARTAAFPGPFVRLSLRTPAAAWTNP